MTWEYLTADEKEEKYFKFVTLHRSLLLITAYKFVGAQIFQKIHIYMLLTYSHI